MDCKSVVRGFESLLLLQVLSLCNVNLVDGLIWSQEAVGSNPTMETNLCLGSLMVEPRCYIP